MTFHQNLPAPAKGDRDTDMQTSTQDSTNAGVKKRSRTDRNHPILLRPILPRPILPMPTLPTPILPPPTLPPPTLPTPILPTPAFVQFPPREPDLYDEIMAIVPPKKSKNLPNSILGKKKAMLGDRMGTDHRERLEIRWEGTTMLGNIDGEYKPAVWHEKIRDRLILMDAQQPGAPVWRPGMSLDYTSYSPFTSDWTDDPATILDDSGREVCLMDDPPKDWKHNPKRPYLVFEGKFVLDVNNRPIKDYKEAPLSISIEARPSLLEGLYRTLGMTNSDIRARMRPIRYTSKGPQFIQGDSIFTNKRSHWKEKNGMKQWHSKAPKKNKKTKKNETKVKDEDKVKEEEKAYPLPESMDTDDTGLTLANRLLSTMPGPSSEMTASNGLSQHETERSNPPLLQTARYDFASAEDISPGLYYEVPTANMPISNVDSNPTGINTSRYPSQFAPQNIYAPGPSSTIRSSNGMMQHETQQVYSPLLQTGRYDFAGARDISRYPSQSARQNIYAPGPSSAMTASNGLILDQTRQTFYPLPPNGDNNLAGATGMLTRAYSYGQPTTGYVEQIWRGNQANAPTFSGANVAAQNANNVGSGNINTSVYPLANAHQNQYTTAVHAFDLSASYTQPFTYNNNYPSIAPTPSYNHVPAPTYPVPRPVLGGFNRPDPNRRYEVDDFWDQELARQEPSATNFPAQVQATPQPAGPPRPQPLGAALPAPVQPAESAPTALSSPAGDPFLGAEYSPVSPEDWLNSEKVWRGER